MGVPMLYAALKRPLSVGRRSYMQKNELLRITIESEDEPVRLHLVLMADWWIDQISAYIREGEHVERGQVSAKIHVGSQVDMWTPRGRFQLDCAAGDRVMAGSQLALTAPARLARP